MSDFLSKLTILKDLLDSEELVNSTILTEDGGRFRVHLEVLFARSPYFKWLITATDKKSWDSILIPGTSKDTVSNIIKFMYTGKLYLAMDRVTDLVKAAEFLELPEIVKLCKKFLMSNMEEKNCIFIYTFAKSFEYRDLKEEARLYIMKHFQQIFPTSMDYLKLEGEDLVVLLSNDNLNVRSEENVFWAIVRWVENDPATRMTFLPSLLRCIRFGLCNRQVCETSIASHPYMLGSEECQVILLQASQLFQETSVGFSQLVLDPRHLFLRPRIPRHVIFVLGGWSAGSATNLVETYDVKCRRWFLSAVTDSTPRAYHGMLWHKGYIYVIGGFDGNHCFNSVRRFDPVSCTWEERSCMYFQRCYVSTAAIGDYLYAMGGYDGNRRSKTCERYDPVSNQWTMVASMNHVRSDASADSLNGKIYIAGGFNGQEVLNSAECYDPEQDVWTPITTMTSPRSGIKLVAYCEYLYIIGGFNGNSRLATVERYDPIMWTWTQVPRMSSPRSNFATAVMDECLYVIGGFNGLSTIPSVECFDHRKNLWLHVTNLNLNRSALAACTISDIPNAHEYTYLDLSGDPKASCVVEWTSNIVYKEQLWQSRLREKILDMETFI